MAELWGRGWAGMDCAWPSESASPQERLLWVHHSWGAEAPARPAPHLIGLPHVAVEDPSHALHSRVLQLVGPPLVIVDAPGQER